MTKLIPVATPLFWWRTTVERARQWLPQDPDVEDGGRRHADHDHQRWDLIAQTVAQVGNALAAGTWTVAQDSEDCVFVELDSYPNGLTRTEQDIVAAWFSPTEAVRFDPWDESLFDGRHRLWATMPHFGTALIPVLGCSIGYANPADAKVIGEGWKDSQLSSVEELDSLEWFDDTDPLNASFRRSLLIAGSGEFPSPINRD